MLRRPILAALAVLACASIPAPAAQAQVGSDLNISPKRVVFDERTRSATVYLFNQGDEEAIYTVSLVDRIMLPGGEIVEAGVRPDMPLASAADLIQHTPRRVVLAPRESQAIRLRARPAGNGQGEYRTHLTITAVPNEATGFTVEQALQDEEDLAIRIVALFSLSIPLIVREGVVDSRAGIENPALLPAGNAVSVDLTRLGVNSIYGDLEVHAVRNGREEIVGEARGVAVYPETPRRSVAIPLSRALVAGETLRIVYRDQDARPGLEAASAVLQAP